MTIVVPFDGTDMAASALDRAVEIGTALEQPIEVITVVPKGNKQFARERGWLDDGPFDMGLVTYRLTSQVKRLAPDSSLEVVTVGSYAPPGTIANRIRRYAKAAGASLVVLGSENAGRITTSLSSIGGSVATETDYDVLIVRNKRISAIELLPDD